MRIKIPALILLCAAAGWLSPSDLNAEDDKKPAETRKSVQAKKADPGKKPESKKRKSPRKEAVEAELKKLRDQLAENGKELGKARESLHTAQKELAAKAQSIKSLEAKKCDHEAALKKANEELKKYKSSDFNKLAHALDDERKKNAALRIQLKEFEIAIQKLGSLPAAPKKPEPKKPEPKKPEPKKPAQSQAPTIAPILYDLNSAVNYHERARVLKELRAILKKFPNAKIQITGYADDSPYRQTNDEVASNRAKFLLKYLCLSGVPEKQLSSLGIGSPKQGSGKGNRKAVVQVRN